MVVKKVIRVSFLLIILMILAIAIELFLNYKIKESNEEQLLGWIEEKQVNEPEILEGMTPVTFTQGIESSTIATEDLIMNKSWYDYIAQEDTTPNGGTSKWANVKTQDGSYWVWIPRFAYKISYINPEDKSDGGTIDVVFLKGSSNKNKDNIDVTTMGYIVHPAFQNGKKNNFANGEWDKELRGMWVAKFEAGCAEIKNTSTEDILKVKSEEIYDHEGKNLTENFSKNVSKMEYPVFIGRAYTYNNLQIGEMFRLSKTLTAR